MIVDVTPVTPSGVNVNEAGPRGPAGKINSVSIEIVAHDQSAAVTNVGTEIEAELEFEIPAAAPPVLSAEATTLSPGSDASVTVNETAPGEYEFELGIPRGNPGVNGANAYLYIAYAEDASGTGFTMTFDADLDYVALKQTTSPLVSPSAGDFTGLWKNTRGATGPMPIFEVGSVTTGDPGSSAVVDIDEIAPGEYAISFTIPRGDQGDIGDAMMMSVYDPNGVEADVFDMDNMADGALQVAMTVGERAKLGVLPDIHRGTINTQAVIQEIAWATGASRWKWVLEGDASLALYFYNSGGALIARYLWEQNGYFTTPLGIRIQDGGGNPLSIYLASTLTAGRTFALRMPDSNIDLTLPASGTLINADRVKYKAGTGVSASGASVTFSNLDCDDLLLVLDGVSHNNGSNTTLRVDLSTDNGSSWAQGFVITAGTSAANSFYGIVPLTGLREGYVSSLRADLGAVANWSSPVQTSGALMNSIKMGGKVNAVKVSPTAGSFDAGTIYASQRN